MEWQWQGTWHKCRGVCVCTLARTRVCVCVKIEELKAYLFVDGKDSVGMQNVMMQETGRWAWVHRGGNAFG